MNNLTNNLTNNLAVYDKHNDVILDSGANCNFLNFLNSSIKGFEFLKEQIKLGDSHTVESIGSGRYGILKVTHK
jgi:hypothetical protein